MYGFCTHTLHNTETLEPITWIRVCPLPLLRGHSQVLTCFVQSLFNISKYLKFKPIVSVFISYINLPMVLTLKLSLPAVTTTTKARPHQETNWTHQIVLCCKHTNTHTHTHTLSLSLSFTHTHTDSLVIDEDSE